MVAMPVEEAASDQSVISIPWTLTGDFGEVRVEMCLEQAENLRDKLDREIAKAQSELESS